MQRALKSAYPRSQTEHEPVLQSLQFGVHADKEVKEKVSWAQ